MRKKGLTLLILQGFFALKFFVNFILFNSKEFLKAFSSHINNELTRGLEYFLATGNLITRTGVGLMQLTGFSVIAERINQLRFVSHFRYFFLIVVF